MMMSRPNTPGDKKDLHFGGLGAHVAEASHWAAVTPLRDGWERSGQALADSAVEFVRRKPLAALAVAGAVGLVFGLLLARKG